MPLSPTAARLPGGIFGRGSLRYAVPTVAPSATFFRLHRVECRWRERHPASTPGTCRWDSYPFSESPGCWMTGWGSEPGVWGGLWGRRSEMPTVVLRLANRPAGFTSGSERDARVGSPSYGSPPSQRSGGMTLVPLHQSTDPVSSTVVSDHHGRARGTARAPQRHSARRSADRMLRGVIPGAAQCSEPRRK